MSESNSGKKAHVPNYFQKVVDNYADKVRSGWYGEVLKEWSGPKSKLGARNRFFVVFQNKVPSIVLCKPSGIYETIPSTNYVRID